jgi:hypothetical protein
MLLDMLDAGDGGGGGGDDAERMLRCKEWELLLLQSSDDVCQEAEKLCAASGELLLRRLSSFKLVRLK